MEFNLNNSKNDEIEAPQAKKRKQTEILKNLDADMIKTLKAEVDNLRKENENIKKEKIELYENIKKQYLCNEDDIHRWKVKYYDKRDALKKAYNENDKLKEELEELKKNNGILIDELAHVKGLNAAIQQEADQLRTGPAVDILPSFIISDNHDNFVSDQEIKDLKAEVFGQPTAFMDKLCPRLFKPAEILDYIEGSEKYTRLKEIFKVYFPEIESKIWKKRVNEAIQNRKNKITVKFYLEFKKRDSDLVIMIGDLENFQFYKCKLVDGKYHYYPPSKKEWYPVEVEEAILGEKDTAGFNHKLYHLNLRNGKTTFLFEKTRDNSQKKYKGQTSV